MAHRVMDNFKALIRRMNWTSKLPVPALVLLWLLCGIAATTLWNMHMIDPDLRDLRKRAVIAQEEEAENWAPQKRLSPF